MEAFLKYLPEQPMWVVVLLGVLGMLGYLSRHIREILGVISFKKTRALEAKVEMTTDLKWLGQHGEDHVGTVEVNILNKGAVRLYIDKLQFSVRAIYADSVLEPACAAEFPRLMSQLYFPEEIDDGSLFPEAWDYAWIDPGCRDGYRHPITIPREARFIMVWVKLWYPDDVDDFQHEQHFCAVPNWEEVSNELREVRPRAGEGNGEFNYSSFSSSRASKKSTL